jgi:protein-L-isoaspartate(D-aspartate) O-methyltransferase
MTPDEIERARIRARYAARAAGPDAAALEAAFARVAREDFLPPPPWTLLRADGAELVTSAVDSLYDADALVVIDAAKGVNNGQPSLHGRWLAAVDPKPGERVVHVGCGGGYYSAVLAELVGPAGRVDAYEVEPAVAALAGRALAGRPNVRVRAQSGAVGALPFCDVIYVNAAAPAPERVWVEALAPGGRLIFPWRYAPDGEAALLIARAAPALPLRFSARALGAVRFIGLHDGGAPASAGPGGVDPRRALAARRLILRSEAAPDARCVADFGWGWLST